MLWVWPNTRMEVRKVNRRDQILSARVAYRISVVHEREGSDRNAQSDLAICLAYIQVHILYFDLQIYNNSAYKNNKDNKLFMYKIN